MPVRVTYRNQPLLESVIRGKRSLRSVVDKRYKPNSNLMNVIGNEIIEGFKGGRGLFMEGIRFTESGKVIGNSGKAYPYGIRREKSPDGTPYAEMSPVTLKLKREKGSHYTTSLLQDRGGSDESSLINSLNKTVTYSGSGIKVYFENNNEASSRLETGGNFISGDLGNKSHFVPARPHRGVQDAVRKNIQSLLKKWMAKNR